MRKTLPSPIANDVTLAPSRGNPGGAPPSAAWWKAVASRDPRHDGRFVFAVRTTGVYCRPSCPARRPRRENVLFFAGPVEAEGQGFRACRRCRPRDASGDSADLRLVREACRRLDSGERTPLSALAAQLGSSPSRLQRAFRRLLAVAPRQYADAARLRTLRRELRGRGNVTHALYEAGYGSSSRLYERSSQKLGMTPAGYARGGGGLQLGYATCRTPLGRLLVAATERGIAAVRLGDDDAALLNGLAAEFPHAQLRRDERRLGRWLGSVVRLLSGREPHERLPLDARGTAFQRRVWEELQKIPRGTTRSYSEVASRIGRPTAARAVAQACSRNPVAVVVPCHRVVAADGGLGGYRWGLERKRRLLKNERSSSWRRSTASTK
jgi:AraC family transcriptional regulator, regulatory protein of adaptative response / methylated-DNA-[protein]-cysteine methyltransferase